MIAAWIAACRAAAIGAAAVVVVALGACRSSAPLAPAAPAAEPPAAVAPAEPGVPAFELRHRQAAQAARREGRLADARWHWDVIVALRPDDADAQRERRSAEDTARLQANERAAKARAARQQGDVESARRLNLEALQAWPLHAGAADELRALERDRTRRGHVQALYAMRREARAPTAADDARARNDAEHAVLMARADAPGRDGAADTSANTTADADACRRAPRLEASDTAAAVRAWQQCLKARPGDPRATARLKALAR